MLAVLVLSAGCKTASLSDPVTGSGYKPQNFYRSWGHLAVNIRRVAVLPATCRLAIEMTDTEMTSANQTPNRNVINLRVCM